MGTIDELTRLQSLLNEGAISQEEFEMLKKNVISDSQKENSTREKTKKESKKETIKEIKPEEKVIPSVAKNAVLKKITCTNCGAELLFDPTTQLTSCNFCNSHFEIKNSVDEQVIVPEGIVPFTVNKQEYESSALKYLSEGEYTPIDILETSVFSSVNGIYLPVWYYSGKYSGNWSASSGYDYVEEYQVKRDGKWVTETRVVTDWRPSSGNCDGDLLVTGYAAGEHKSELVVFTWHTVLKKIKIKPFDSKYTIGFNLIEFELDEHESWDKYGQEAADHYVRSQVYPRIPGDHYKDLHVEAVYDKEKPLRIYYPVWITYYKYKGQEYYVWIDGNNPSRVFGSRPIDESIKSKAEFFSKLSVNWKWVVIGWLIVGIISHIIASSNSPASGYTKEQSAFLNFGFAVFGILVGLWPVFYFWGKIQKKIITNNAQNQRNKVLKKTKNIS